MTNPNPYPKTDLNLSFFERKLGSNELIKNLSNKKINDTIEKSKSKLFSYMSKNTISLHNTKREL